MEIARRHLLSPDMCPHALDLLGRAVFIAAGQWWTDADCDRVAAGISKVLDAYRGRASDRAGWPA
jgi:hypothetical protein